MIKDKLQGTLRLFIAFTIVLLIGLAVAKGNLKPTATNPYELIGYYIACSLFLLSFLYMLLNGIRQFKEQKIKYKGMYWVSTFIFAICGVVWVPVLMRAENYLDYEIIYGCIFLLSSLYFVIADFITLFIKRRKNMDEAHSLSPADHLHP